MALGNWASMCWDEEGNAIPATIQLNKKIWVELYKNWVYIHVDKATHKLVQGEINLDIDETISIKGLVSRDTKDDRTMFAYITISKYTPKTYNIVKELHLIGISCYAFTNSGKEVGVTKGMVKRFFTWLRNLEKTHWDAPKLFIPQPQGGYNQGWLFMASHLGIEAMKKLSKKSKKKK